MPTRRGASARAPEPRRPPRLALTVQYASRASGLPGTRQLRRWTMAALLQDAAVTLRIVGAPEGRRLNRAFRGKDYATNVLSFRYPDERPLAGDIVLCAAVVRREARERGISLEAHYAHLVVHGVLHLQGYDHERRPEAQRMERKETEIVSRLGYPDPYSV
ncbi:MAG TPA: rRNA maturation RNase YbeY [Burkholderiales bacterium]|nr:rRNA maturation RNase YbeY [Burkholderiales bacterium]